MKYETLKEKIGRIKHSYNPKLVLVFAEVFPLISCNGHAIVELEQFREQCEDLKEGEVFVFGRADDCDCLLQKFFKWNENEHKPCLNKVSRYHCFIIKREQYFELWDMSFTWTAVLL